MLMFCASVGGALAAAGLSAGSSVYAAFCMSGSFSC
jgi:hypothetical protein